MKIQFKISDHQTYQMIEAMEQTPTLGENLYHEGFATWILDANHLGDMYTKIDKTTFLRTMIEISKLLDILKINHQINSLD